MDSLRIKQMLGHDKPLETNDVTDIYKTVNYDTKLAPSFAVKKGLKQSPSKAQQLSPW